jgi:hypothetical protein
MDEKPRDGGPVPAGVFPFPLGYEQLGLVPAGHLAGVEVIVPPGAAPDPTVTACGTALVDSATCPSQAPCPGLT